MADGSTIGERLVSLDWKYVIDCHCDRPCATFEQHILRIGGDIYLGAKDADEPLAPGAFELGEVDDNQNTAPGRVRSRPTALDTADGLFPASAARFGGKVGESVCATLAWFAFAWLIWNVAGAIARGISGH